MIKLDLFIFEENFKMLQTALKADFDLNKNVKYHKNV